MMVGEFESITIEPAGSAGKGVEFRLHRIAGDEVHQVKGGLDAAWTIRDLERAGVLGHFQKHLTGTSDTAVFFSVRHAAQLDALRRKAEVPAAQWLDELSRKDIGTADQLKKIWGVGDEDLHGLLRRIEVRSMDDRSLPEVLRSEIEARVERRAANDVRSDLEAFLTMKMHIPLTAHDLWTAVRATGGRPRHGGPDAGPSELVRDLAAAYAKAVEGSRPDFLAYIDRPEVKQITRLLTKKGGPRTVIAQGRAGSGKSTICAQVVEALQAEGVVVGALRLDPATAAATAKELGAQEAIGFGEPVADVMRKAAGGQPCVLVIDQFDALSAAAGRGEAVKDGVRQTLEQVRGIPGLRLLIACRGHDLKEDWELRRLLGLVSGTGSEDVHQIDIGDLDAAQLSAALTGIGFESQNLPGQLHRLLGNVFNLSLLAWIVQDARLEGKDEQIELGRFRRQLDLLREYDKRLGARLTRDLGVNGFATLTQRIADQMSCEGLLSIPVGRLADVPGGRDALLHHGILIESGRRVRFFHQSYFEFVFAQHHFSAGHTATDLLRNDAQDLVRRGQARMVLALERESDYTGTYTSDLREVLTAPGVRTHVRAAVLDWLTEIDDPGEDELTLVVECAMGTSPVRRRARTVLWVPVWVQALHQHSYYNQIIEDLIARASPAKARRGTPGVQHFDQLDSPDAWLMLEAAARCEPERTAALCIALARDPYVVRRETWQVLRLVFLAGPGAGVRVAELFTALTENVRDVALSIAPPEPDEQADPIGGEMAWALGALFQRGGTDALHTLAMKVPSDVAVSSYHIWLDAADRVARHLGSGCAFDPKYQSILPAQETGLGTLQTLAEREPSATATALVPFVLEQAEASSIPLSKDRSQTNSALRADRIWHRGLPERHAYESEVLSAATTALSLVVRDQPSDAQPLLALLKDSDLRTAQNLAGAAYANAAMELLDDAIAWADRHEHQQLHTAFAEENRWAFVIAHILNSGSVDQRQRAERLVTEPYTALDLTSLPESLPQGDGKGEPNQKHDQLVQEQYTILDNIARRLGEHFPEALGQRLSMLASYMQERNMSWAPQSPIDGVFSVVSPVPQEEAEQFSDDDWIESITRVADARGTYMHTRLGVVGGADAFSQVLSTVAGTDPVRFVALLPRMAPPINPDYPRAVLNALSTARSPMNDALRMAVCDAIRTIHSWGGSQHSMELSRLVRTLVAEQVPDDILEIITTIARDDPSPTSDVWKETAPGGKLYYDGSIGDAGLNCVRGNALRTIGALLNSANVQPSRVPALVSAIRGALNDEREQVRVMIPEALLGLTAHNLAAALELTCSWLESATDAMLAAQGLPHLAYRVSLEDLDLGIAITQRMLAATAPNALQSAGQLAVVLPLAQDNSRRSARNGLLERALSDPASRHGVGVALVQNADDLHGDLALPHPPDAPPSPGWTLLVKLLDDPNDEVANSTAISLGAQLQHLAKLEEGYGRVLTQIASTRGFLAAGHQILRGLHLGSMPIPDTAVELCRAWFDQQQQEMTQVGTSGRATAAHLVPIVLSIYGGTGSTYVRTACLDLLDELIEAGVEEASRAADDAETSA